MKICNVFVAVSLLLLTGCAGSNADSDDVNSQINDTTDITGTTDTVSMPNTGGPSGSISEIQTPDFQGELVFTNERRFDVMSFVESIGHERPLAFVLSRNGESVIAEINV